MKCAVCDGSDSTVRVVLLYSMKDVPLVVVGKTVHMQHCTPASHYKSKPVFHSSSALNLNSQ